MSWRKFRGWWLLTLTCGCGPSLGTEDPSDDGNSNDSGPASTDDSSSSVPEDPRPPQGEACNTPAFTAWIERAFEACPDTTNLGQVAPVEGVTCADVCCAAGFSGCAYRAAQADSEVCADANPAKSGECDDVFATAWSSQCVCTLDNAPDEEAVPFAVELQGIAVDCIDSCGSLREEKLVTLQIITDVDPLVTDVHLLDWTVGTRELRRSNEGPLASQALTVDGNASASVALRAASVSGCSLASPYPELARVLVEIAGVELELEGPLGGGMGHDEC
jgi:hypothetical protein